MAIKGLLMCPLVVRYIEAITSGSCFLAEVQVCQIKGPPQLWDNAITDQAERIFFWSGASPILLFVFFKEELFLNLPKFKRLSCIPSM